MTTAATRYGIPTGYKGRAGAAFYSDAAQIIAGSAARESQILAAQSSMALQTVATLGTTLSEGFSKYLDYKTEIKTQSFEREMKLRDAERLDDAMEIKRQEAEDNHLESLRATQAKDLDMAQKWQEYKMQPLVRKARAESVGLLSQMRGIGNKVSNGTATVQEMQELEAADGLMGDRLKQMALAGVPQAELEQIQNQWAPIVAKASSVKFSNGETMTRGNARKLAYVINTAPSQRLHSQFRVTPELWDPEIAKANAWVGTLVASKEKYTKGDTSVMASQFLADQGISAPAGSADYINAKTMLDSFRRMPKEARAHLVVSTLTADDPDAERRVTNMQQENPRITWAALEAAILPADPPDGTKVGPDGRYVDAEGRPVGPALPVKNAGARKAVKDIFVRERVGGGTRKLEPHSISMASLHGISVPNLPGNVIDQLISDDYSSFDVGSNDMLKLGGPGAAPESPTEAAFRKVNSEHAIPGAAAVGMVGATGIVGPDGVRVLPSGKGLFRGGGPQGLGFGGADGTRVIPTETAGGPGSQVALRQPGQVALRPGGPTSVARIPGAPAAAAAGAPAAAAAGAPAAAAAGAPAAAAAGAPAAAAAGGWWAKAFPTFAKAGPGVAGAARVVAPLARGGLYTAEAAGAARFGMYLDGQRRKALTLLPPAAAQTQASVNLGWVVYKAAAGEDAAEIHQGILEAKAAYEDYREAHKDTYGVAPTQFYLPESAAGNIRRIRDYLGEQNSVAAMNDFETFINEATPVGSNMRFKARITPAEVYKKEANALLTPPVQAPTLPPLGK